ncbi:tRNA (guanosine(46)-N7)-methyltransferase TrmB [Paenibacillus sp. FSL H8-0548]|uniref:tRNA (guanosine(46)-N7)-methyltransferase TrmB n=1 Tax=Paenibacillus sp. FSL H8-0548 TaxID=1920422 RepID=UPI00096E868A|nr:tRNA (guanosine(46)-N7)-methyltransferase TrmB [Paenibacillus sp. FSL H8-0548]OMF38704.1 tRNA (guanosine(46)-N7)-methyltransferase TrmB [Paenibacillus sp. FSL H8-0548]
MRLRGRKGIRESLEGQPELVVLDAAPHKGKWHEFFGNDHPIYVELGMGKGRFISQMSARYPHINFIGVDMYDELLRRASEKARIIWEQKGESHPPNLALLRANIENIETMFAPGELERVHLNFSDPWPKSKHARRRLTHPRLVAKYIELLNERGEIHFKTDSQSLFEFSLNSFAEMELVMRNISLHLHKEGPREDLVFTEYEMKFMEKGQNIYRVEAVIGTEALMKHREAKQERLIKEEAEAVETESNDSEEEDN